MTASPELVKEKQLEKLHKEVKILKETQHLLDSAEALVKSITFIQLSEARESIKDALEQRYLGIGKLSCS